MKKINLNYEVSDYEKSLIQEYNDNCIFYDSQKTLNEDAMRVFHRNSEIILILEELDTLNEDIMFEMANFKKEKSGLDFNIWIDDAGSARKNTHHTPRLKVQDPDDEKNLVSVSIDENNPVILAGKFKKKQNLNQLFDYIRTNYNDFMEVWNQNIDATDFINKHNINK